MDDTFVPLATFVRGVTAEPAAQPLRPPAAAQMSPPEASVTQAAGEDSAFAHGPTARELTLMRLAALEAFERAKSTLLEMVASEVLGRELMLAPVDIAALVTRLLDGAREIEPVALILAPGDAQRVETSLPVRVDATLEAGDFIVEVRDGAFESPVRFRLEAALGRALERDA